MTNSYDTTHVFFQYLKTPILLHIVCVSDQSIDILKLLIQNWPSSVLLLTESSPDEEWMRILRRRATLIEWKWFKMNENWCHGLCMYDETQRWCEWVT